MRYSTRLKTRFDVFWACSRVSMDWNPDGEIFQQTMCSCKTFWLLEFKFALFSYVVFFFVFFFANSMMLRHCRGNDMCGPNSFGCTDVLRVQIFKMWGFQRKKNYKRGWLKMLFTNTRQDAWTSCLQFEENAQKSDKSGWVVKSPYILIVPQ